MKDAVIAQTSVLSVSMLTKVLNGFVKIILTAAVSHRVC